MLLLALLFAQLSTSGVSATDRPADIEIQARVQARDLRIEQQQEARIGLFAEPPGGDQIEVERNQPKGRSRYRDLDVALRAEVRVAAPDARGQREANFSEQHESNRETE